MTGCDERGAVTRDGRVGERGFAGSAGLTGDLGDRAVIVLKGDEVGVTLISRVMTGKVLSPFWCDDFSTTTGMRRSSLDVVAVTNVFSGVTFTSSTTSFLSTFSLTIGMIRSFFGGADDWSRGIRTWKCRRMLLPMFSLNQSSLF